MNCVVHRTPASHVRVSHVGPKKKRRVEAFCENCAAAIRRFGTRSHLLERIA